MIRILSIQDRGDRVVIQATLDSENKGLDKWWVIPESELVPKKVWGMKISTPMFQYDIEKITKL